jgi:hypothetical protein
MLDIVHALGAGASLASVVGMVVLSALHVSHAREIRRLREWAGRAPERSGPGATAVRRRSQPPYRWIFVALALAGAAAYGVAQLSGGGDGAPTKAKPRGSAVKPGSVTVAVLNGTTVPGLAARLRDKIAAAGFKKGAVNDFSDKQLAESVVQYAPGHQAAAKAVSRAVGVSKREPVTSNSRALAGNSTVIVIAGADKAPYR